MTGNARSAEDRLTAVMRAVDLVRAVHPVGHPLRVLVLFDPDAHICQALAARGDEVACCPDRQGSLGVAQHVAVLCEDAVSLTEGDARWDLVVAADGWTRFRDVTRPDAAEAVLEWVRTHSGMALLEAPRRVLAPDLNNLGPFEVRAMLGGFEYLSEPALDLPTPLVLASDHHLLAGGEWFAAADLDRIDDADADADLRTVRTYRAPGDRIVKVECASEDYLERSQVLAEAVFLGRADARLRERLGLPRVRDLGRGRAVVSLVRDRVEGATHPDPGSPVMDAMSAILDLVSDFAGARIFHNDLRPWNIVWEGARARLVDFGDSSGWDEDVRDLPQVLALAGTLAAVATTEIRGGEHFHHDVLHVARQSGALDRWPVASQFTDPWLMLPATRARLTLSADLDAGGILVAVLEATVPTWPAGRGAGGRHG